MISTITKLAICNNRKNRTRSALIILSVFLTTLLLVAIATFGYGSIKSNHVNAKRLYGGYHGSFRGVTEKQLDEMSLRAEFDQIGRLALAGEVEHKNDLSLYWADDTALSLNNGNEQLLEGMFPQEEDEIAAPAQFFIELGYSNPKLGDTVSLKYRRNLRSTYVAGEFVISGILKEGSSFKKAYAGYVSQSFYEELVPEDSRSLLAYFSLEKGLNITSDGAEDFIKELAGKCGIDADKVSVNGLYLMFSMDPGTETIIGCVMIASLIVIFSIVVIYNIFQVGIVQKIQEYGKLKALGATKKQLKAVVLREGMILAIIGILPGLMIGFLLSKALFSWLMEQANILSSGNNLTEVSLFSLPLLLLVTGLSLLTVWLALRRPIKLITRTSPIESIRYSGNRLSKKGIRKGRRTTGVKEMTFASLSNNRGRTVTTICTMGLSCILFVVIANFVGNIDNKYDARQTVEYGQLMIRLDYSLGDSAYPENNLDSILKINPLNKGLINQIEELKYVTGVKTRRILAMKEKDPRGEIAENMMSVAVLDRIDFNRFKNKGGQVGLLDYDKATEENAILFGWSHSMEYYGYTLDKTFSIVLEDGVKQVPYLAVLQGAFGNANQYWVITEDTYKKLHMAEDTAGYIWVDCAEDKVDSVQEELESLLANVDHIEIDTFRNALQTSQFQTQMMKMGAYTLLALVGLIGFMNMANTIIISIITRKQEFGVLQALGMTNRQLNRMLQLEGLLFTIGTVLVAAAVGIPAGYQLFCYGKSKSWIGLHIYHFPITEMVIMVAGIAFLQFVLSFILSRNIKKESLVERIRYQE